jgi:hypothetical protein
MRTRDLKPVSNPSVFTFSVEIWSSQRTVLAPPVIGAVVSLTYPVRIKPISELIRSWTGLRVDQLKSCTKLQDFLNILRRSTQHISGSNSS